MDRPINKIFSDIMWEREKKILSGVNKINNNDSMTGRDQDVHTYQEIKSTVEDQYEPIMWEMGSNIFVIAWQ